MIAPFLFRVNKFQKFLFHFCSLCAILSYINSEVMPVFDMKLLGENIRHVRKIKGLTQEELAKKAGMSTMSIRRYENGERIITVAALKRIATALNIPYWNLISDPKPGEADGYNIWQEVLQDYLDSENQMVQDILNYLKNRHPSDVEFYGALKKSRGIELLDAKGKRLVNVYTHLNDEGQQKAIERVEELAEVPRYRRQDPAQPPVEATLDSTDGKDTPTAQDAPEGAEKAE